MVENISKEKIPKNYAYILKTKEIEYVFMDNNINIHTSIDYRFSHKAKCIFDAYFWPPNDNISYKRLYITTRALQKEIIPIIKKKKNELIFPDFVLWIKSILSLPNNSPNFKEHRFYVYYENNSLKIYKTNFA